MTWFKVNNWIKKIKSLVYIWCSFYLAWLILPTYFTIQLFFLLLFMSLIAFFGTIHESHCIISVNFYLYLLFMSLSFTTKLFIVTHTERERERERERLCFKLMNLIIVSLTEKQAQPTRGQWGLLYLYVIMCGLRKKEWWFDETNCIDLLWFWTSLLFK